ncbi:hypothetical protein HAX54_002937, partial [Datura stramonium]|nr:hypothetical protein [Datura stramonium]
MSSCESMYLRDSINRCLWRMLLPRLVEKPYLALMENVLRTIVGSSSCNRSGLTSDQLSIF